MADSSSDPQATGDAVPQLTFTALREPGLELDAEGGFVRQFLLENPGHRRGHRLRYTRMDEHVLPAYGAHDQISEPLDPPGLDRLAVRRSRPGGRRQLALPTRCGRDLLQVLEGAPGLTRERSIRWRNQIRLDREDARRFAHAGMNVHTEGG